MAYRAQLGGAFGSGMYFPPSNAVDVGAAIDSLTNGASSLIHGAYLRRQATQALEHQRQREQVADQRYTDEQARRQAVEDRDYNLRVQQQRSQDLANGVTPASTDITLTPPPSAAGAPAIPTDGGSAIRSAMTSGLSAGTPAGASTSPLTAPVDIGALPTMNVTETPESYDPTQAATFVRAKALQDARIDAQKQMADERNRTSLESRKIMKEATVEAARIRANAKGGASGGGIRGAMTAGQQERKFETIDAPAILSAQGWNLRAALDDLNNSDEGKALKAAGFTSRHLVAAYEKHVSDQTTGAMRLQTGALGMSPEESVGAVGRTRQLVSGGSGAPAAAPATAPTAKSAPATTKPAPKDAGALTQQRADYDRAAAALRKQGKDPVSVIGARP